MPVGSDYFRVIGVRTLAGQPFDRDAERANADVVVISERIWREYLGARADAVGQTLSINGVRQQVVAVVPDAFEDPLVPGVEIWTPLDFQSGNRTQWFNHYLSVIGRLRPGATLEQAQAELKTIARQIEPNYGQSQTRRWARVTPLQVDTVGTAGSLLWILLGAVGLLLTIACVNVAGLVLARGAAREQELAVRAALGCSRWRLARQLIDRKPAAVARRRHRRPRQRAGSSRACCSPPRPNRSPASPPARAGALSSSLSVSSSRSWPDSRSVSHRRCSTRARISKACCGSRAAARAAAAVRPASGRCSSSPRSRSPSCS